MLNRQNNAMSTPFYGILMALSYIKGPLVEDWVNVIDKELEERTNTANPGHVTETDEVLWNEFEATFKSTWKDTARSASTYDQLMKLVMKDLDMDMYTTMFECLTAVANWEPDAKGTIAHDRHGLRESVHCWILNHKNLPTNMVGWKEAARKEVN
jgi:hypothetical protein